MSLTCDVTGKTDRVEYLPLYMQTETVKKVCFRVAVKMEQERLAPKAVAPDLAPKKAPKKKALEVIKEKVTKKKQPKKK